MNTETARRNNSSSAIVNSYDLNHPFAEGSFRYVAKGTYTSGRRRGERCVAKWFKTGSVYEESYFHADIKTANKCIELVTKWNDSSGIDKTVQVNLPAVWTFDDECSDHIRNTKVLIEPFISNYEKFNSNTGWYSDGVAWGRAMQALSHCSYDASGGNLLLCDLQGGVYSNGIVLTDPVIMSQVAGQYGPTDLGSEGISSFFATHRCNEYCRRHWRKPRNRMSYYNPRAGTTMEHVPTRTSRPAMTHQRW